MEIQIKAYAYTIDIITEIRYFCKCNNAVFGKFRFIFTCAISKTDCSLHHSFHALFKISGNGKFVRTAAPTFPKPHYPSPRTKLASLVKGEVLSPERIRATTGGIATSLLPKPHYPSPRTKLASPRKRVRFCCSVKPSQLWWGLNLIELLSLKLQSIRSAIIRPAPTLPKPHYPTHFS